MCKFTQPVMESQEQNPGVADGFKNTNTSWLKAGHDPGSGQGSLGKHKEQRAERERMVRPERGHRGS